MTADPPPRCDHGDRRRRLLASDGRGRGGDGASVREHREAARPIVAGFGGRIVKTTGDGLLLEFPSVVAAVECAIAIQKLMVERNADDARGEADRLPHRRQSRRRADRGRRHSGRRGQHRGAARRHLRARRRADFRRRLRTHPRQDRRGFRRSRREGAQEYRAAGAGLCDQASAQPTAGDARAELRAREIRRRRASRSSSCRSPISAATRSRSISSTGSRRA